MRFFVLELGDILRTWWTSHRRAGRKHQVLLELRALHHPQHHHQRPEAPWTCRACNTPAPCPQYLLLSSTLRVPYGL